MNRNDNYQRTMAMLDSAELCIRYARNLSELPHAADAATECGRLLKEAAELTNLGESIDSLVSAKELP